MHVQIHTAALNDVESTISDSSARLVRMRFNPSNMETVERIKALAAATISAIEEVRDGSDDPFVKREAAAAITEIQKGSMLGVAAATAHL